MTEVHTEDNHPFPNLYKLGKERKGLYLGCPIWRQTEMEWHVAMTQFYALAFNLGLHFYDYPMVNDALIQRSRSRSASDFLKTDAQVFVQVDGDIAFSPLDILKIAEATFTHDIVGGAYVKRMQEKTEIAIRTHVPTVIEFLEEGDPVEVEYLSGGFYAVHRRVLEKLLKTHAIDLPLCHARDMAFYPFFADKIRDFKGDKLFLSEDWAFFERCREAGFKCYVDPTVRLGHVGNYTYTLEDMARRPRPEYQGIRFTRYEDGKATLEGTGASPHEEVVTTADGFKMHVIPGDMTISESIRKTGYWDAKTRDVIVDYINRARIDPPVFLDLGAHFGYYSLLVAHYGADVISVEPNPVMMELLVKSQVLNKFERMTLFQMAVSSMEGTSALKTSGLQNNGESYLITDESASQVKVTTIDNLLDGRKVDIAKIDIEGEEYDALLASPKFLKDVQVLIIEVSERQLRRQTGHRHGQDALFELLESRGFTLSLIEQHGGYADWLAVK